MDQGPAAPPGFASWGRLYAAVLLLEAVVILGIAAFSVWPY
jgi:hypothetical protein